MCLLERSGIEMVVRIEALAMDNVCEFEIEY